MITNEPKPVEIHYTFSTDWDGYDFSGLDYAASMETYQDMVTEELHTVFGCKIVYCAEEIPEDKIKVFLDDGYSWTDGEWVEAVRAIAMKISSNCDWQVDADEAEETDEA